MSLSVFCVSSSSWLVFGLLLWNFLGIPAVFFLFVFFFVGGGGQFCLIFMMGMRVQVALKAGQHRPVSQTPFKWHSVAGGAMMTQN